MTPNAFKKNASSIQYLNIVDEELDINSASTISFANMQTDALGDGILSVKAGNIEKFKVNIYNFTNLYQVIDGTPTAFADAQAVLDFFFEPAGGGGGTSDNGTYLAYISYNGDNNPLNMATLQALTINGDDYSGLSVALDDWSVLSEVISDSLLSSGITNTGVLVSKGLTGNISNNTGTIVLYIQVFYPSAALSLDMTMLINGGVENFSFNKIPTV